MTGKTSKVRPAATVEVMTYRSSGGYPYFKTILLLMVTFVAALSIWLLRVASILEISLVVLVMVVIILVFGLSPAFTVHQVGSSNLVLRHGWYFSCRVPLKNIWDVVETEEGVPGHGVNFLLGGNRLYLTNSRVGLVRLRLHERQRMGGVLGRNISEIVLNLDEPVHFVRVVRERAGLKALRKGEVGVCPTCQRPLVEAPEAEEASVRHDFPQVEAIFLVHNDGRLIASYKSGRIQTKETFSVTGMLTVIQDFVGDAFKRTEGSLKTLEHGDIKVIIERGAHVYLAVLLEGREPPKLRKEMRRALDEIHSRYGDVLDEDWDGEITDIKVKTILAQILWI